MRIYLRLPSLVDAVHGQGWLLRGEQSLAGVSQVEGVELV